MKKVISNQFLPAKLKIAAGKKINRQVARKRTGKPAGNVELNNQGATK